MLRDVRFAVRAFRSPRVWTPAERNLPRKTSRFWKIVIYLITTMCVQVPLGMVLHIPFSDAIHLSIDFNAYLAFSLFILKIIGWIR